MFKSLTRLFRRQPAPELLIVKIAPVDNKKISVEDRRLLRDWLEDKTTKQALGIVEAQLPTIMLAGVSGSVEDRRYSAERRLTQLQGWYSFRNTLLSVGHTPDQIKQLIQETYSENP